MEDYKPNSFKSKQDAAQQTDKTVEKKEIKPVTTGTVRKKSGLARAAEDFVKKDIGEVKNYAVSEVLIPALKKAISDIVSNGVDMILYHGESKPSSRVTFGSGNIISYNEYSRNKDKERVTHTQSVYGRNRYSFDDVILPSRAVAQEVLDNLCNMVDSYGIVSVADYYELVNAPAAFTDNKYGWSNLSQAEIVRVHDGYMLKLPPVTPFD